MKLSKLIEVDPRAAWPGEATHFTPWLLDNPSHLEDALGIDLELSQAEHPVGGFSLDLLGRDLTNGTTLIVENQLEQTDHSHLGQLLTYAAGTEASTIVWIATNFREEHRQAIDWLNANTGEDIHFFGIRLGVVRIGDSPAAPLLEVVAQPNDWQKQVRAVTRADRAGGARAALYVQFWTRYLERVRAEHPTWTRARVPQNVNWITQPSRVPGTSIGASFAAGGRLRHELYIDSGDAEVNLKRFRAFVAVAPDLQDAYGRPLEFEELPERKACRIVEYGTGDVAEVEHHDDYIDWMFDCGVRLRHALDAVGDKVD